MITAGYAPSGASLSSSTSGLVGTLSAPLSTGGGNINSLQANVTAAIQSLAAGGSNTSIPIRLYDPISRNSQGFAASQAVQANSQSIPVAALTPNYNYPAGTFIYAQPILTSPSPSPNAVFQPLLGPRAGGIGASYMNGDGSNAPCTPAGGNLIGGGWFGKMCLLSNGLLRPKINVALSAGNDGSAECLAKIGIALAAGIDVLFFDPGPFVHDVGTGVAIANTKANVITLIQLCQSAKLHPVFMGLPAVPSGGGFTESQCVQYNQLAQAICAEWGATFIDAVTPVVNPVTGGWVPAMLSSDTTHPSDQGAMAYGVGGWAAIQSRFNRAAYWLPTDDVDNTWNLLAKGLFTGGAGNAAPPSWGGSGSSATATFGYSTVAGILGQVLTIADGNTNTGTKIISQSIPNTAGWTAGDTIALVGRLNNPTLQAAGATIRIQALFNGASDQHPNSITALPSLGADFAGIGAFYQQGVIPAGTTSIAVSVTLTDKTGGNTAATSVGIGQLGVYDLTALGIAD